MRRIRFVILFLLVLVFLVPVAEAQKRNPSLTSTVTRQTPFNSLTDTLSTFGKPEKEKKKIIRERKDARRIDRLKKIHAKKKAQKQKERLKIQKSLRNRQ